MISFRIYLFTIFLSIPGIAFCQLADSLSVKAEAGSFVIDTSYFETGEDGFNLILAAEKSDLVAMEILMRRGTDPDYATTDGITPLMYASENGNTEAVLMLLEHGADPDIKPNYAPTALISAAKTGSYDVSAALLNYGASVDERDENDLTALMYSSAYNNYELTELLLNYGADPSLKDGFGSDALMISSYYNSYECAKVLVEHGCEINSIDNFGFTPLIIASQQGYYNMAWFFLDKGADISARNKAGLDALGMAVTKDLTDIAELLIESGAQVNQTVQHGNTLLDIAKKNKNNEMINLLKSNGAKMNFYPYFSLISAGTGVDFNGNDFMAGLAGAIHDSKYGLGISLNLNYRVAPVRVLAEDNNEVAYQYWERRWAATAGINKGFRFGTPSGYIFGPFLGLDLTYTWGSYRGADRKPHPATVFSPAGGVFLRRNYFGLDVKYSYRQLNIPHFSPHRISIGFYFYFNAIKDKLKFKEISWF